MATATHDTPHAKTKLPISDRTGGHLIQCVVVTPERTLLDERSEFVALPLYDGELGVLPGRTPFIGRLGYGELRTKLGGKVSRYFVDGGFAQVRDDVVTVLTSRAFPVSEIRPDAVSRELAQALERRATSDVEQAEKAKALTRARAQLRIAAREG
jgi:F-type H+-transporting ATPase subunit epsilon